LNIGKPLKKEFIRQITFYLPEGVFELQFFQAKIKFEFSVSKKSANWFKNKFSLKSQIINLINFALLHFLMLQS